MRENVASTLSDNHISAQHMLSPATHRAWGARTYSTYIRLFKIPGFHCFSSSRLTVPLQEPEGRLLWSRKQKEAAKLERKNVNQHWRQIARRGPASADAWASSSPPRCLRCASGPTQQWQAITALKGTEEGWSAESFSSFFLNFSYLLSMFFNDLKRAGQADPSYSSCPCALSSVALCCCSFSNLSFHWDQSGITNIRVCE